MKGQRLPCATTLNHLVIVGEKHVPKSSIWNILLVKSQQHTFVGSELQLLSRRDGAGHKNKREKVGSSTPFMMGPFLHE